VSLTPLHHSRHVRAVADYYRDEDVRARILEYCGATTMRPPTAAYLKAFDPAGAEAPTWESSIAAPPSEFTRLLEHGSDVSRSLWDTERLLFFLELDYQNVDYPAEPFVHPADVFLKLESAYRAVGSVFAGLHLRTRPLVTGRGYHFVGQIPLSDPLVDRLAALAAETPAWLESHPARRPPGVTAEIDERQARAATGLGLLLEYAAHLVLAQARESSPLPVVFNGTVVGRGVHGRECVSIDVSHAGDPLDIRHLRTAFSPYQWHRRRPDIFGADVAAGVPPLVTLPRGRQSLMTMLLAGRDLDAGLRGAHATRTFLPNVAKGVGRLLKSYEASRLATFHRAFYDARRAGGAGGRTRAVPAVPPCVGAALAQPNDLLLKPEHVQHLVRDLLSRGWPAAEIAALVQSKYEEDHGWGDRWTRLDRRTRAEFDVRVFAGLVATGADTLVDFNCVSAQEKDLCPRTGCQYDLTRDRDRLLAHSRT
jgi:hypothetical protein